MAIDGAPPAGLTQAEPLPPLSPPGYPIHLTVAPNTAPNQFWALPVVGMGVKLVILVPHLVLLSLFGLWVALLQLVLWIPVLFRGRYLALGYRHVGGALRWSARVSAYLYGLTDRYPPFSLASDAGGYPVDLKIVEAPASNRFFAVPLLGAAVRYALLIPHLLVLSLLVYVATSVVFGWLWFPVLFGGKYPRWGQELVASFVEWQIRVSAYLYGLTDRYPPFEWDWSD
jgi:hypothetical protein